MKIDDNAVDVIDASPVSFSLKRINLHDLKAIRLEIASVYRDMRTRKIPSCDGTRCVYVLRELSKLMIEEMDRQPKQEMRRPVFNIRFVDGNGDPVS